MLYFFTIIMINYKMLVNLKIIWIKKIVFSIRKTKIFLKNNFESFIHNCCLQLEEIGWYGSSESLVNRNTQTDTSRMELINEIRAISRVKCLWFCPHESKHGLLLYVSMKELTPNLYLGCYGKLTPRENLMRIRTLLLTFLKSFVKIKMLENEQL